MAKPRGFSSGFSRGFGVGRYYYGLKQYAWVPDEEGGVGSWQLPPGVVGAVDLRTIPQMSVAGGAPQGFAFVASMQPVDVLIARSLHFTEENATGAMQDAWESELGYRPQGAKVVDLLWDALTAGADPDGESGPKPLVPGTDMLFKLFVGGHSLVKRKKFRASEPEARPVLDMLRKQYRQLRRNSREGKHRNRRGVDGRHYLRCLDYWAKKYRLPYTAFIGNEPDEGTIPHETTWTETWPTDGTDISTGQDQIWTELTADVTVSANRLRIVTGGTSGAARCETALSSSDNRNKCDYSAASTTTTRHAGPGCRFDGAANSAYMADQAGGASGSGTYQPAKVVTGTRTLLGTGSSQTQVATKQVSANGSTIAIDQDGVEVESITDTALASGLHGGAFFFSGTPTLQNLDNFEAADLAVAAGQPTWKRFGGVAFAAAGYQSPGIMRW